MNRMKEKLEKLLVEGMESNRIVLRRNKGIYEEIMILLFGILTMLPLLILLMVI